MKYETNFRKQLKLLKFSVALETLFMGFLVDKKIASTLQTLTRKDFFKHLKNRPTVGVCYGLLLALRAYTSLVRTLRFGSLVRSLSEGKKFNSLGKFCKKVSLNH